MDVEVIIKRALVYAAALAAIAAIYAVLLRIGRRGLPARRGSAAEPDHRAARDVRRRAAVAAGQERDPDRARSRLLPRPLRLPPRAGRLRARSEQRSRSPAAQRAPGPPRHRNAGGRSHGADAGAGVGRRRRLRDHRARRVPRRAAAADAGLRSRDAPVLRPHARARRESSRCAGSTRARWISGARPGSTTSFRASPRKARSR